MDKAAEATKLEEEKGKVAAQEGAAKAKEAALAGLKAALETDRAGLTSLALTAREAAVAEAERIAKVERRNA